MLVTNRDIKSNLLINDGFGTFQDASFLLVPDGNHTYSIQAGDLNGDALPDLMLTNGGSSTKELLMINSVTGTSEGFVDGTALLMGAPGANANADDNEVEFFDVDSDGDFDVVIAAISPGKERVLLNDGDGFLTVADSPFDGSADATLDLEIGDDQIDGVEHQLVGAALDAHRRRLAPARPPTLDTVEAAGALGAYLGPVPVVARITDMFTSDTGPRLLEVTLDGQAMRWAGGSLYWGTTGAGLVKAPFDVKVTATDPEGNTNTSGAVSIAPRHPLDVFEDGQVDDNDLNIMRDHLLDKGGLGKSGDIDGDGDVTLSDAQLLASGLGGFPILSRAAILPTGQWLMIGANFGTPTVSVDGATAVVTDHGAFSLLADVEGDISGPFVVNNGAEVSNALEVQ